jgi:hypothetical protein
MLVVVHARGKSRFRDYGFLLGCLLCLSFEKLVQNSSEETIRYQILKYDLALNICSCMDGIGCA